MRIRLKDYNPEFAYYYFRTTYFQYLIEVYKKGLGNNTNIFPIVIREFPLIDIPLPEQYRIVSEIHAEIDKQKNLKAAISDMQQQIDQIVEDSISWQLHLKRHFIKAPDSVDEVRRWFYALIIMP